MAAILLPEAVTCSRLSIGSKERYAVFTSRYIQIMINTPIAMPRGIFLFAFFASPPIKPTDAQPWYAQNAESMAVNMALKVTGLLSVVSILNAILRSDCWLLNPKKIMVNKPANTNNKIAVPSQAPVFKPLLLIHVSIKIRTMAVNFTLKFLN